MANLPEKNITTIDKVATVPSASNLYINANGEFRQASIDEVIKASSVVTDSIANQFKTATGSPLLLTDSAEGYAPRFAVYGRSEQTQYSGKNKLNPIGMSANTNSGITFTPICDDNGSLLYANVNGTATEDVQFVYTVRSVPKGTHILNGLPSGASADTYRQWLFNPSTSENYIDTGSGVTFTLSEDNTTLVYSFQVRSGITVNNLKIYPMVSTEGGEYEPYTNGASPNPDYPQAIESVGDSGWFDGELLQGGYSTSGSVTTNSNAIYGKNPIPCKEGDNIKATYEEIVSDIRIHYFNNGTFLSYKLLENVSEITDTAPTNATEFTVTVVGTTAITPSTAKHICVTINNNYALIEKSVGKNLLKHTATSQNINGVTFTVKDDGTVTANGKATSNAVFYIRSATNKLKVSSTKSLIYSGVKGGSTSTYCMQVWRGNWIPYIYVTDGEYKTSVATDDYELIIALVVIKDVTVNNVVFEPMIRPVGTDDTYEPYKEDVKYTPISAPLRSSLDGSVTDVARLTEGKVDRKFDKVVLDGSDDEGWIAYSGYLGDYNCYYYNNVGINAKKGYQTSICSHFTNVNSVWYKGTLGQYSDNPTYHYKYFITDLSLEEFKTWLQANPITVIYELAEPTTESIEPTDIVTFEGVTHISVSDDAEMVVEYPTSRTAGVASVGYIKGIKAEYQLEQLKAQLTTLQTAVVNTL